MKPTFFIVLALVGGGVWTLLTVKIRPASVETSKQESLLVGQPSLGTKGFTGHLAVHHSAEVFQDILWGAQLDPDDHTGFLVRNRSDYNSEISDFNNYDIYTFYASFDILQVSPKEKDHFYVLGKAVSGEDVIERWKKAPTGMPGNPSGYTLKKKELYRGAGLNGVHEIMADRDGRYLLLRHGNNPATISKMDLPGGAITTLFDETNIVGLADMDHFFDVQHAVEGRLVILVDWATYAHVVLHDTADDGVFESIEYIDDAEYESRYGVYADQTLIDGRVDHF